MSSCSVRARQERQSGVRGKPNLMNSRYFAIVPAAGKSRRMGNPKLLLPWHSNNEKVDTIIDAVLCAWTESRTDEVVVVVRKNDDLLIEACSKWPVRLVSPDEDPSDMKASICCAISTITKSFAPSAADRCLVAPADIPNLNKQVIDRLIEVDFEQRHAEQSISSPILVPAFDAERGHPALFPWNRIQEIFDLRHDEGLNAIVDRSKVALLAMPNRFSTEDIDTPEDYRRVRGNHEN